jgi:hypothetical protein
MDRMMSAADRYLYPLDGDAERLGDHFRRHCVSAGADIL